MKIKPNALINIAGCVVVVAAFASLFFIRPWHVAGMAFSESSINYCTDTPEGKAVIGKMSDRFSHEYKIWNDEDAVVAGIQEIDRVRIWTAENTTGDEQKAWMCWTDYFMKEYVNRSKILHAQNTIKTPPK